MLIGVLIRLLIGVLVKLLVMVAHQGAHKDSS